MNSDLLWINEGFILDEAGNLITTSYIDLHAPGSRTAIRTLVKGCRREHALEDAETILVSPLERFRDEGEALIRDEQEGLAREKTETVKPKTPEEAFRCRRVADLNRAIELLDSGLRITRRQTSHSVDRSSKHLAFGKEWWIFSTALTPETDEEWAAWRATLDPAYDHESEIGQPAKFAEALGRMVTEQIGPQSKDGWMRATIGDGEGARTKHRTQWIMHGPVVYADRLYDTLTRDADEATRLAASIFTKSATHAAQREYRFAILRDGTVDEKVLLTVSGMMRDALQPTTLGLVRPPQATAEATANEDGGSPSLVSGSTKLRYRSATAKERVTNREERRWETRGPDGQVLSSESERRESVHEKTVMRDLGGNEKGVDLTEAIGREDDDCASRQQERGLRLGGTVPESGKRDEDAVKEIALEERGLSDRGNGLSDGSSVVHGTGRAYKSLEEMFKEQLNDPAFPMGGASEPWAEEALSREEVLRIYEMVATLAHKVTQVSIENREAASSACWHAIQCIRNIYVRLGDIVGTLAIERERFVVLRIKALEEFKATGRIVVAPSGAYAYCFKRSGKEQVGHGEGEMGMIFFPLGSQVETFESFGWPPKVRNTTNPPQDGGAPGVVREG